MTRPRTRIDSGMGLGALLAFVTVAAAAPATATAQGGNAASPVAADSEAGATASQEASAGWLAWAGCWEAVTSDADAPMRCLRPGPEGVDVLSVAGGEVTEVRRVRADGVARPVEDGGCRGTEAAEFSDDATRVYWSSELECDGRIRRESSRMWAMVTPREWIEVRSVAVHGGSLASVERYRVASTARVQEAGLSGIGEGLTTAIESARLAAAARLAIEDVIEAHDAIETELVEAWIAERGDPLWGLNSDRLVRLADAGVAPDVIDVVVAVSYPEKFRLDRQFGDAGSDRALAGAAYPLGSSALPGYLTPWSYYYSPWGYRYRSRFFDPWGGYYYDRYNRPTTIIVRPVGSADDGGGRVVRGRGYSRSRPSDRASSGRPASGSRSATPRRPSSSGSSTGRKAKPRSGSQDPPER